MSRQRPGHLRRACEILLAAGKPADTVCGWVQNIGRKGQKHRLLTLAQLQNETVDMFTTVFIGNAFTQNCAGRMVTARGYNTQGTFLFSAAPPRAARFPISWQRWVMPLP